MADSEVTPMRIKNNPFDFILSTFAELYPEKNNIEIEFIDKLQDDEGNETYGVTYFPDESSDSYTIYIVYTLSIADAAEILCHELAHVVCGYEADHNEEWERVFNELMDKSMEKAREAYEKEVKRNGEQQTQHRKANGN